MGGSASILSHFVQTMVTQGNETFVQLHGVQQSGFSSERSNTICVKGTWYRCLEDRCNRENCDIASKKLATHRNRVCG